MEVDGAMVGLGVENRDTLRVKILIDGKRIDPKSEQGQRTLREAGPDGQEVGYLMHMDTLISDLVHAFGDLPSGDSLLRAVEGNQSLWLQARARYCGDLAGVSSAAEARQACLL